MAASGIQSPNGEQRPPPPAMDGHGESKLALTPFHKMTTNPWNQQKWNQSQFRPLATAKMGQPPQFVVIEMATAAQPREQQPKVSNAPMHGLLAIQSSSSSSTAPFLPFRHPPTAIFRHQNGGDNGTPMAVGEEEENSMQCGPEQPVRFSMIQLTGQHSHHRMPPLGTHKPNGRLLFDNPMFRQLPNWHFFGDDRRHTQIPPIIPLLRIPVERTLLSITPSPSAIRQLILMGILDLNNRRGGGGQQQLCSEPMMTVEEEEGEKKGEGDEENEEEGEGEEEGDGNSLPPSCCSEPEEQPPLPPDSGGCPSSSGVESMSSGETITSTTSTECAGTPVRSPSPEVVGERREEEEINESGAIITSDYVAIAHYDDSSSAANSASSSTPNSPPTFDRRTQRLSRATRDAVLRLSISRRFCDDEDIEEEEYDEANHFETDDQMALRIRHTSSNASLRRNGSTHTALPPPENNHSRPPFTEGGISCMDVLSERIYNFNQNAEQSNYQLNRKLLLRDQLYYAISAIFPTCGLYVVGSSLNGFGSARSDLDLCLLITPRDIDQRTDALVILTTVKNALEHSQMVIDQQLIRAKVPILRIKCTGTYSDIMVDLNVNNSVAIRNTHLMYYYSGFDWRVRPIVVIVKEWAKRRGINNASCSTFTSYSLVLMVIHYLQCGAKPPVLPSLQHLYPQRFSNNNDVRQLNVSQPLDPQPSMVWKFDQQLSLSDLLLGFLKYYAYEFDFNTDAISIRLGRKLDRSHVANNQSPFNSLAQWHCICIEEPFTLSNAAHSIYDERIFQHIKKAFADSYIELDKYRDLDAFLGPPIKEITDAGVIGQESVLNMAMPSPTPMKEETSDDRKNKDENTNQA